MKAGHLTLLSSFLFLGAFSLAAQILIIREFLVIFYGNELCLGLVFGGWFAGIALGAGIGGIRLREKGKAVKLDGPGRARSQFVWLMLTSPLILLAQIIAIRGIRGFLGIPPGESIALLPMAAASLALVAPFSMLVGAMFPAACVYLGGGAPGIGRVYVWEAVGSMAGGLVLTFFLIQRVPPFVIASSMGVGAALCVMVLNWKKRFSWEAAGAMALIAGIAAMAATGGWSRVSRATENKRWKDLNPGIRLVDSTDSVYQHIDVGLFGGQYSLYGNGQLISTFPDPYRSAPLAHLSLSVHPDPGDVLIMGAVTGDLLEEMLLHSVSRIHVVELDQRLLAMVLKYQDEHYRRVWSDPRVRIFHDDGRRFIQRKGDLYDVIIVNAPDPSNAFLNRLYTLEFYQQTRRRLKPRGILVTGASLAVNYIGRDLGQYGASIFRTLKRVFPQVMVVPGEPGLFLATDEAGEMSLDPQELSRRFLHNTARSEHFSGQYFESLLPGDRIRFLQNSIEGVKAYRINSDARPVAYFYNIILWELFSAPRSRDTASVFGRLAWLDARVILLMLAFLTGLQLLRMAPWKRSGVSHAAFNSVFAIAATGMAAMSAEMVLLFSYQSIYGYLYHRIGLVVASFMLGLAAGGWAMSRTLKSRKDACTLLVLFQLLVSGYMLLLPHAVSLFRWGFSSSWSSGAEVIFMAWVSVAGILTGGVFPLAGAVYLSARPRPGEAAGLIDAMDHLGALVGAVLTGSLFLPLMGTFHTCIVVAAINLAGALFMGMDRIICPQGPAPAVRAGSLA